MNVLRQPAIPKPRCPHCGGREGLNGARQSLHAAYDVMSDSYGLMRCPNCGHKAGWAEFHRSDPEASVYIDAQHT